MRTSTVSVLAFVAIWSTPLFAAVTHGDALKVLNLSAKALAIEKSMNRAISPTSDDLYCGLLLGDQLAALRYDARTGSLTLSIAAGMTNKDDEAAALEAASGSLQELQSDLSNAREAANYVQGSCGVRSATGAAAAALLDLTDEINMTLAPLMRRVGRPKN